MTADELRKLAEIAGLVILENYYGPAYYSAGEYLCQVDGWQPHLRIEQAMMVAEELTKETCLNFVLESPGNTWLANFYDISVDKYLCGQADTPALAICRAALAAEKEG